VPIYRSGAEDEFAFITPILTERELSEKIKQITQNGLQVLGSVRVLDY